MRHAAARCVAVLARILAVPLAAIAAALAGLVYVVLLPICGLASIAEAVAKASWRYARRTHGAPWRRGALSQH